MDVNTTNAALAYASALQRVGGANGPEAVRATGTSGPGFADMIKDVVEQAAKDLGAGEKAAVERLTGDTEIIDLVTAVTSAEMTLQTVVAVRDRIIQAYQEIIQMPI